PESLLEAVVHLKLRVRRIKQRCRKNRDVGADRHRFAVKDDHEAFDALNTRHREDSLVYAREINGSAKRPAESVFAALERMKVVEESLLHSFTDLAKVGGVCGYDFRIDLYALISRSDHVQLGGQKPALIEVLADRSKRAFAWNRRRSVAVGHYDHRDDAR